MIRIGLKKLFRELWEELLKPSNFKEDIYGFFTNHISKGFFGIAATSIYTYFMYKVVGEYPDQFLTTSLSILAYFFCWEILLQRWKGLDTVLDTLSFAVGASIFYIIDMSEVIERLSFFMVSGVFYLLLIRLIIEGSDE